MVLKNSQVSFYWWIGNLFMLNAVGKVRKVFQTWRKSNLSVEKVKEKWRILCSIEAKPRCCKDFKTFLWPSRLPRLLFLRVWKTFLTLPTAFSMNKWPFLPWIWIIEAVEVNYVDFFIFDRKKKWMNYIACYWKKIFADFGRQHSFKHYLTFSPKTVAVVFCAFLSLFAYMSGSLYLRLDTFVDSIQQQKYSIGENLLLFFCWRGRLVTISWDFHFVRLKKTGLKWNLLQIYTNISDV